MPLPDKYALDARNDGTGYMVLSKKDRNRRTIYEHVLIAEKALGKPLPPGAIVHHANENRSDNRPGNLVICESQEYHKLLHTRMTAKKESGDANLRKCWICKEYSALSELKSYGRHSSHDECRRQFQRAWHFKNKKRINARRRKKNREGRRKG